MECTIEPCPGIIGHINKLLAFVKDTKSMAQRNGCNPGEVWWAELAAANEAFNGSRRYYIRKRTNEESS